jgi:hypothetical protein
MAFKANYLTGIFLILIGVFFIGYISIFNFSLIKGFVGGVPLIITFLLFWKKITISIVNQLVNIIGQGWTSSRLMIFNAYIQYGESLDKLTQQRDFTRKLSIETFFENPLFGSIFRNLKGVNGEILGFGQHSFILDTFSLFGVIIGLLNLFLIIYPFMSNLKRYNRINRKLSIIVLFITLLFFYTNNAVPSIGFAIFMLLPMLCDYSEKSKLVHNNNSFNNNNENSVISKITLR